MLMIMIIAGIENNHWFSQRTSIYKVGIFWSNYLWLSKCILWIWKLLGIRIIQIYITTFCNLRNVINIVEETKNFGIIVIFVIFFL